VSWGPPWGLKETNRDNTACPRVGHSPFAVLTLLLDLSLGCVCRGERELRLGPSLPGGRCSPRNQRNSYSHVGLQMSRPAGHISVGSEPRRGRMKGQETRRRQQDKSFDQAAKFYCSHRGIYVLREWGVRRGAGWLAGSAIGLLIGCTFVPAAR
jgi:hypothetical protein